MLREIIFNNRKSNALKKSTAILHGILFMFFLQTSIAYADGSRDLNFDLFKAAINGDSEQAINLLEQPTLNLLNHDHIFDLYFPF